MKYNRLLLLIGVIALSCSSVNAQEALPRSNRRPVLIDDRGLLPDVNLTQQPFRIPGIPVEGINAEQYQQLRLLQTEKQKKLNLINNQLAEKRAQQQTLEILDKPDMKAINKLIDEQVALLGSRMKVEAEYKQKIRSILTEEQRVEFDSKIR